MKHLFMNRLWKRYAFVLLSCLFLIHSPCAQNAGANFKTAVYVRSYEVRQMGDLQWLDSIWTLIEQQVHIDKVYLETHRDLVMVPEDTLERVIRYFEDKGILTAGGITYTINERNRFQTFCYTDPGHREKVKEIIEYTALHFDEIILDDFFFTNCKCHGCIEAKGEESWTQFRLRLMEEAARELIMAPAQIVNPDVEVIIKYPNWYAHFQGLGFNLASQPDIFDGIYTGTETRDATLSAQHLQPYHGYSIFRYFENIKPGGNKGGWVDTGASFVWDRYAEQLWITLFAKAPEITLFDFRQMQRPLSSFQEAPWADMHPSLDRQALEAKYRGIEPATIAQVAGYVFEKVDPLLSQLGDPAGIKIYRPFHAVGEDFLPSFLGMAGIPVDIVPAFPAADSLILLTESAAADPEIVSKIQTQLMNGKSVVITSGLLKVLQDKGLSDIAELRYTGDKAMVSEYVVSWRRFNGEAPVLIPQIKYLTNDSWEVVSAIDGPNGWPLLHEAEYAGGSLFILVIPDNYADLYRFPEPVLNAIRAQLMQHQPVQLQAPAHVSIFLYDNNTLVVESFRDEPVDVGLLTSTEFTQMVNLEDESVVDGRLQQAYGGWGQAIMPPRSLFNVSIPPHSFRAFRLE